VQQDDEYEDYYCHLYIVLFDLLVSKLLCF